MQRSNADLEAAWRFTVSDTGSGSSPSTAPANCYLTKPVDLDQFVTVVRSIEDFWLGLVRLPPK